MMETNDSDAHEIPSVSLDTYLNSTQLKAVQLPIDSHVQIVAGPGTGKTITLVNRLMYLLSQGVPPEQILVLTFTNRSVSIFREKLAERLPPELAERIIVHTYHSCCQFLIGEHAASLGLRPGWALCDDLDQDYLLRQSYGSLVAAGKISRFSSPQQVKGVFDEAKAIQRSLVTGDTPGTTSKEAELLCATYSDNLISNNLVDYDGLLLLGSRAAREHLDELPKLQTILVDEFQDSNLFQWEFIKTLAHKNAHVNVVGDPDQSIFSFQGACDELFSIMRDDLDDVQKVVLTTNYRSSNEIVSAATEFLRQGAHSLGDSELPVGTFSGPQPSLHAFLGPKDEEDWIANEINRLLTSGSLRPSDIAILTRTNARKDSIVSSLQSHGIDVSVYGPLSILKHLQIRPLYTLMKFVDNFDKDIYLAYLLSSMTRVLPVKRLDEARKFADERQLSLWGALGQSGLWLSNATQQSRLASFVSAVSQAADGIHSRPFDPEALVNSLEEFANAVNSVPPRLVQQAKERRQALYNTIHDLAPRLVASNPDRTLASSVVRHTRLQDILARDNEVVVSTVHNSKGLEWSVVFVADATHRSFPHFMSKSEDEERRVLYVGLTRAKDRLYVTYPKRGMWVDTTFRPSPFFTREVQAHFNGGSNISTSASNQMTARFASFNQVREKYARVFEYPANAQQIRPYTTGRAGWAPMKRAVSIVPLAGLAQASSALRVLRSIAK